MTDWPLELRGVTETLVATEMPDGGYNLAALGVHAGEPATARTWGNTRTRRAFHERGSGVVQFVDDPLVFVEAALGIVEREDPVHPAAGAWARVRAEPVASGETDGTRWERWALEPVESAVETRRVPRFARGPAAVIEASVWASRLDAPGYDRSTCEDRIAFLGSVVDHCGDDRAREAFGRLRELADLESG